MTGQPCFLLWFEGSSEDSLLRHARVVCEFFGSCLKWVPVESSREIPRVSSISFKRAHSSHSAFQPFRGQHIPWYSRYAQKRSPLAIAATLVGTRVLHISLYRGLLRCDILLWTLHCLDLAQFFRKRCRLRICDEAPLIQTSFLWFNRRDFLHFLALR